MLTRVRGPSLADPAWVSDTLRRHHRDAGLEHPPSRVDLLEVRLSRPETPDSARCVGRAVVRAHHAGADRSTPILLLSSEPPAEARRPFSGLALWAWRFPEDPGLPGLPTLVDPAALGELVPDHRARGGAVAVEVVRWQPGTSATLRYRFAPDAPGIYAKVLADAPAARLAAAHRRVADLASDALRIPELLGADETLNVVWTRELAGLPLVHHLDRLAPAQLRSTAARLGSAVAALHSCGFRPTARAERSAYVTEAVKKAHKLAVAHQPFATPVREVAGAVEGALGPDRSGPAAKRCIHGDLHLGQILATAGGPALVDLDEMALGDPEADLAELAVDVHLRRLPEPVATPLLTGVYAGYREHSGLTPDPGLLRGHVAAEFLNRCYRHLRSRTAGWQLGAARDLRGFADLIDRVTTLGALPERVGGVR